MSLRSDGFAAEAISKKSVWLAPPAHPAHPFVRGRWQVCPFNWRLLTCTAPNAHRPGVFPGVRCKCRHSPTRNDSLSSNIIPVLVPGADGSGTDKIMLVVRRTMLNGHFSSENGTRLTGFAFKVWCD